MHTTGHIEALTREGSALLTAAEEAGWDAEVPSCPAWRIRDLVLHTGCVHRWASDYVAEGHAEARPIGSASMPDGEVAGWFRSGYRTLVERLEAADDTLACWSFLEGSPSPRAFWARRQAHETAVHRVDAELAAGRTPGPVAPEFATDGIDELLTGFHTRPFSPVRSDTPRTLLVSTTDAPSAHWTLHLSSAAPRVERRETGAYDCRMRGPAAHLYLALWNRLPLDGVASVDGDTSVAALWQEASAIRQRTKRHAPTG
ncbi:maleylpyruvate isomerase family mycothiol-dependent enzyme [Streptomyces sp. TR02-1]|uniref:maleylpyruvate isomerase family mycothiol-dependent enzyme n=1 Tax=Streptomyces sp. TR02-1 TaxID=3385977 RepID=UPI0039A116B4